MESNWASGLVCVSTLEQGICAGRYANGFLQVSWTAREMHARLSTAHALSSRIGVRSLKSDRSSSTTSIPSSKVTTKNGRYGVSFSMGRHSTMLGFSLRCTLDMMHTGGQSTA